MPPRAKKQKLDTSPSKPSPLSSPSKLAKGKGKPKPSLAARRHGPDSEGDSDDDEPLEPDEDEAPLPRQSFVTASSGDAYLLHSARPSKTSDSLLSSYIDPAFTLSSYASALATFDSTPAKAFVAQREDLLKRRVAVADSFPQWVFEMQEGFNLVLYGFGSKRLVLNAFAERVRRTADAIVVNGFDPAVTLQDVVGALEELVKSGEGEREAQETPQKGKKGGRGAAAKGKGKGKAVAKPPTQVSAIEGRVRRVCEALAGEGRTRDVYLVIHNLDGPTLRVPKILSLLALLAAHPRVHLLASIDHIRAPLLFPSSLANARPLHARTGAATPAGISLGESRALTFLYHEIPSLAPYTTEATASSLLSRVLPPTVFPRLASSSSTTSFSPIHSAIYVLKSVTHKSQQLFSLLAALQLATLESVDPSVVRSADLAPAMHAPSPRIATSFDVLTARAVEQLIVFGKEGVEGLLGEFRDHGVVRSGVVPPEQGEGEEEGDAGGLWVWISLKGEELEEVLESPEWKD